MLGISGAGSARIGDDTVDLSEYTSIMIGLGSSVVVTADPQGLDLLLTVLDVPG